MKLWIAWDDDKHEIVAAAVTEILRYPLKTVVSLPLIGGTRWQDWWDMHKRICEDAKERYGCVEMHGYARDGWLRPCLKDGWRKVYTFISRPI